MAPLLPLLLLAVTVKQDQTPLRDGCGEDASGIAKLTAGSELTIRFAVSGESVPCYKVAARSDGKPVEGYLPASAIDGLEAFEKSRRDAAWPSTTEIFGAIRSSASLPALQPGASPQRIVDQVMQLVDLGQPTRALELLDVEMKKRKDPTLLALAGVAAWKADESRHALEYWRASLDMHPNPEIESLYRRVERESKGDQSVDKVLGLRVALRYESTAIPVATAREMASALDEEFSRISLQLGCNPQERIVAIVQTRDAYHKTTNAAEWSGGQYDGRIRVPVLQGQGMDRAMRRVFAHEAVHACLSMLGRWPAWLQEGLAQKLSGDQLPAPLRQKLADMAHQGKLPKLDKLSQDWSRLDSEHATMAYALSLAAIEMYYEGYSQFGVGNLVRYPDRLPQITADLEQRLGL